MADGFTWGVSTSAYQIEGAVSADGRGPSIWDTFSSEPGRIAGGATAATACGHYHRYREDLELLDQLGVDAYRFSVAWPRVMPQGRGPVNRPGLDFYQRLTDALLARGIAPWVCLYHWDLPQALQERGGWTDRDTVYRFCDYAVQVAGAIGDRVEAFLLLNEPNSVALLGHLLGVHAPGVADIGAYAAATHHLNLAVGLGAEALRSVSRARIGTVLNLEPVHPATDAEEDLSAARVFDAFRNRNYLDPLLRGAYPADTAALLEPHLRPGDLESVSAPLDLLGLNLYTRARVAADPASLVGLRQLPPPAGAEVTAMGWEVYPQALYDQLMELHGAYGNPPVYVTENGAAFPDGRPRAGRHDDRDRIEYLRRHLHALARARADGADVRGYFVWSLLDNFEWAEGYRPRFGLVHVDYATLARTPRRSFDWYRDVIAAGQLPAPELTAAD